MTFPGFPDAAPLDGFLGGLMIGLAAAIMLLGLGRIAGVSGLASRAMLIERGGAPWPVAILFVAGLVLGGLIVTVGVGPTLVVALCTAIGAALGALLKNAFADGVDLGAAWRALRRR